MFITNFKEINENGEMTLQSIKLEMADETETFNFYINGKEIFDKSTMTG